MKFFSKNSNYRVTLEPGRPADSRGRGAKSGFYVKFKDGVVTVDDDDTIEKMYNHPAYGDDFISETEGDQGSNFESSSQEPEHEIQELEHGAVKSVKSSKGGSSKGGLTDEMRDYLQTQAVDIAKEMASDMAKAQLKEILQMKKGDDEAVTEELEKRVDGGEPESHTKESSEEVEEDKRDPAGVEKPEEVETKTGGSEDDLTASELSRKTKEELEEFAEKEHGIELDQNNLKKQMIDNFFEELNS